MGEEDLGNDHTLMTFKTTHSLTKFTTALHLGQFIFTDKGNLAGNLSVE
jgi:hypothetical protein